MKTTLSFLSEKNGIFLLILLLLLVPGTSAAQTGTDAIADPAILPWLGVWTAMDETPAPVTTVIEISPGVNGRGLSITTKDANQPASEIILPDGISRTFESQNCTGLRAYQWEKQTGLLLGTSEMKCQSETYNILTLKMMTSANRMTDILVIKTPNQTRLAIRRFAFEKMLPSEGELSSGQESLVLRTALAAPWDLDKIIHLSRTLEPIVLEAALLEKDLQVKLDANSLRKMKSAGTPDSIIDLLVAMSAPDKFRIEKNDQVAVSTAPSSGPENRGTYSYPYMAPPYYYGGYYYHPWGYYWSYGSPFWWGYPIYYYPPSVSIPGGGNGGGGGTGGSGQSSYSEGRLSSGSGYVQVVPRDTGHQAVPRGSATPGGYSSSAGGWTGGAGAYSSGGGYSAPAGGASSGVSSSPSASPSGYSGGGSSGTAVPR